MFYSGWRQEIPPEIYVLLSHDAQRHTYTHTSFHTHTYFKKLLPSTSPFLNDLNQWKIQMSQSVRKLM